MRITIDLWLDGYETEDEHNQACIELLKEQLDFSGSSVEVVEIIWTDEWPAEPGDYWFFGWDFGDKTREPEMMFTKIRGGINNIHYVANGHFIYKSQAVGKWTSANMPDKPILKGDDNE